MKNHFRSYISPLDSTCLTLFMFFIIYTDQTLYRTRPFTEFSEVSIEHLRRMWHADRGSLLLRTPGSVPLGLAYVLLVEANPFFRICCYFPDYALRISLGTFSNLLMYQFSIFCYTAFGLGSPMRDQYMKCTNLI